MCTKSEREVPKMTSAAIASGYVKRMAQLETHGFGDDENALRRLESYFGISYWTLRYLKQGRAKTVDGDIKERIRAAYITYCERMVVGLQHDIATEKVIASDAADLGTLEAEAEILAAKIARAKASRAGATR